MHFPCIIGVPLGRIDQSDKILDSSTGNVCDGLRYARKTLNMYLVADQVKNYDVTE